MIRVFLVEDQTLVREGIKSLLALVEDIEVIGEASDGEEAVQMVPALHPDVVLLDIRMPGIDGLEVLRRLGASDDLPPTLILTTFDEDDLVIKGIQAGARGFLLKDVSLEQLTEAIRTLAGGKTLIKPAVTERLLKGLAPGPRPASTYDLVDPLTGRETEILRLMAGGFSNREIGEALHIVEGTVKNHISNILAKMGVRDRTRAVLKGLEIGYV